MSNAMMPPGGRPVNPRVQGSNVMQNLSPMNPNDLGLMAASGEFTMNMTVAEWMQKVGIDVNGPMTQILDFVKRMQSNMDPLNKVRAMGSMPRGASPPGAPGAPPQAQPQAPAPTGGLSTLLRGGGNAGY